MGPRAAGAETKSEEEAFPVAAAPAEDAATMMIPVTVAGAAPGPGAAAGARLRPSSRRISGPTHSVIILRDS